MHISHICFTIYCIGIHQTIYFFRKSYTKCTYRKFPSRNPGAYLHTATFKRKNDIYNTNYADIIFNAQEAKVLMPSGSGYNAIDGDLVRFRCLMQNGVQSEMYEPRFTGGLADDLL